MPWWVWLVAAALLLGVEVLTLDLIALMFAAGALGGASAAALGAPAPVSLLVAAATAAAGLLVVRPVAVRHLRQGPLERTGTAALVGREAVVLERVTEVGGRVRLAGEVWSARTYVPGSVVEPGSRVDVLEIEGATAVVHQTGA